MSEQPPDPANLPKVVANTYNQYETGKNAPNMEAAHKLCDTYKLSLDWIYRGDTSSLRRETASAIEAIRQLRLNNRR